MNAAGRRPSSVWVAKLVLAMTGIAVFGAGIRWDSSLTRWIGIGVVAVAWLLRFVKAPTPERAAETD